MPEPTEVTLGDVTVPVYPQRHAYLANRIGPAITQAISRGEGLTADMFAGQAAEAAYDALSALIPNLAARMPRYQFCGYGSKAAYDEDHYVEEDDKSPSLPEIIDAFKVGIRVNGLDEVAKLGKVLDTRLLKAMLNKAVADTITSTSSPSASGASESMSSGVPTPTSTESEDSPSLASSV